MQFIYTEVMTPEKILEIRIHNLELAIADLVYTTNVLLEKLKEMEEKLPPPHFCGD